MVLRRVSGIPAGLNTTQSLAVLTTAERQGIDATAFPGDTLDVPVNPTIAKILSRYPLPNDPGGPFGARTFATSSRVVTDADQVSGRLDHELSSRDKLFVRLTWDNLTGPTTNPDQTAIDPALGVTYVDHQRNAVVSHRHRPHQGRGPAASLERLEVSDAAVWKRGSSISYQNPIRNWTSFSSPDSCWWPTHPAAAGKNKLQRMHWPPQDRLDDNEIRRGRLSWAPGKRGSLLLVMRDVPRPPALRSGARTVL